MFLIESIITAIVKLSEKKRKYLFITLEYIIINLTNLYHKVISICINKKEILYQYEIHNFKYIVR